MYSFSNKTEEPELRTTLSQILQDKNKISKKHLDSLSCLINCTEYKITIYITQKPGNGKDNLFFLLKGDNFSTLFFYDIASDKVLDNIQKKNEEQKLMNDNQKINSENEIIDHFEQNKKNKILLFNYIKFPLININSENNKKKISTIIILDNGENELISNLGTISSLRNHQTCSVALTINNPNNCDSLFSLSDIKESQEIKIKLNGIVHGQSLFDKEIICYLSSDIILNSIKKRMEKYNKNEDIEKLRGKYFFTKLNDTNFNNIGILFSLNIKKDSKEKKIDKDYLNSDNYIINKIFLFLDVWLNNINIKTIPSTESSSKSLFNKNEEKNNIYNKFKTYSYDINYYEEKESKNDYNYNIDYKYIDYKKNDDEINNSNINANKNTNYFNNNSDYNYNDYNSTYKQNDLYNYDTYYKYDSQSYDYYYNKDSRKTDLNNIFNLIKKVEEENTENKNQIIQSENKEKLDMIIVKMQLESNFIDSKDNYKEENFFIPKTLFINMNEEMIRKLFDKYEQDKCISNYTIIKNMLDININIELDVKKKFELKLFDFLDIFQNSNHININIPFITKKGKLIINSFNPSLSSMLLVLKPKKNLKKKIEKNIKKYPGFTASIYEKDKNILKLEYEEIKPIHERDLLYIKIAKIKKIIDNINIKYKNIMIKNSYFSILWSVTNNANIKSSFLAYYSLDFKLVGILITNLDYNMWFTPYSYKLENYRNYKTDYENNVNNVKTFFDNLAMDIDDKNRGKFFKFDYYNYLKSNKGKND